MKKTYEKPVVAKAGKLAKHTAQLSEELTLPVP
jgi:hypothetical protein